MRGSLRPRARLPRSLDAELRRGAKVEREHTLDDETARIIASHHLAECPFYYRMLAVMEKECQRLMRVRR